MSYTEACPGTCPGLVSGSPFPHLRGAGTNSLTHSLIHSFTHSPIKKPRHSPGLFFYELKHFYSYPGFCCKTSAPTISISCCGMGMSSSLGAFKTAPANLHFHCSGRHLLPPMQHPNASGHRNGGLPCPVPVSFPSGLLALPRWRLSIAPYKG